MEKELFDWDNWDQLDTGCFQFYPCTLKVDIGNQEAGAIIPVITINIEKGFIQLNSESGDVIETLKLHFRVGEKFAATQPLS